MSVLDIIQDEVLKPAKQEWARLRRDRLRLDGKLSKSWMPKNADFEYRDLMRKAQSPWLMFAADCFSDALIIDGYTDQTIWDEAWERSGMSGRQHAINREAVAYGYSYLLAFPDSDGGVMLRHLPARDTYAVKADPWDEEPEYVLHRVRDDLWRFFDSENMYEIKGDLQRGTVTQTNHGLGINPVTIIQAQYPTNGEMPESVVAHGEPAYKRVVDATFTLQMIQRYGAFPQKWQAGGVMGVDENGAALVRPSVDSLIHNEDELVKFGSFPAADIDKATTAVDEHLQQLAAILHIPPHYLLGKVVNLSAEALAATETGFIRKLGTIQEPLSEGYESALRKAAFFLDDLNGAMDYTTEVHWQDVTVRTLAASVDAIQKLDAVGAPKDMTLQLVPGWSRQDVVNAASTAAPDPVLLQDSVSQPVQEPTPSPEV
ncbi:phage portal protein [Rothia sp. LK2588]|uniref:phage portal protein n=1 Tax=Rothia sp. LK2588 TaxID=3114369 RepID=UPI0034CD4AA7